MDAEVYDSAVFFERATAKVGLRAKGRGAGYYWAFLYVFESAFAFEAHDFVASADYRSPFVGIATGVLFVDFPQHFCVVKGYWYIMFCQCCVPKCVTCETHPYCGHEYA